MPEPQEVLLGFQADLASGATQQEFRASKVKLVRYGKTNGIGEVKDDAPKSAADIYDLSGRRVTTPTKGVYIIGGREVMVR